MVKKIGLSSFENVRPSQIQHEIPVKFGSSQIIGNCRLEQEDGQYFLILSLFEDVSEDEYIYPIFDDHGLQCLMLFPVAVDRGLKIQLKDIVI